MNVYLYQNNTEKILKNAYIGEYGWKPWSNTLFYSNWDNGTVTAKVWTITNYWWIIAKQSWTNVLYISWTNVTRIDIPTLYDKWTWNYHYNVWLKVGTSNFTAINYNNWYSQIAITQGTSWTIHAWVVEANLWWGSWYSFNSTIWVFHNVAINYLWWWTCDVYIDWVFKWTSTNTQTGYGNTWSWQWFGVDSSKYSTWNWYVWANIVEDKVRTADEISTYYNQTKSNYWL